MYEKVLVCHLPRAITTLPEPELEMEGELWKGWGFSRSWDCCNCDQATLLLVTTLKDCLIDGWFVSHGAFVRPLGFPKLVFPKLCIPKLVFS